MLETASTTKIPTITDLIVRKSNLLIQSGTNMNLMEQRIILTTMAQILANDLNFDTYRFSVPQLSEIFGLESSSLHKEVRKVSDSLMEKYFRIPKEKENDFRNQSVVDYIDYSSGILSVKLADGLKNELLNLKKKGHFTSYEIEEIVRLRKTSSMRLYELLIRDRRLARKKDYWIQIYTLEDLRDFLYIEDRYKDFRSFNQKVLKPAIKEINENTSLCIEEKPIRSGRITSHIEFKMREQQKGSELSSDIEAREKDRYLEDIEENLKKSSRLERDRFEEILENIRQEESKQLPLFNRSKLYEKSMRNKALIYWAEKNESL